MRSRTRTPWEAGALCLGMLLGCAAIAHGQTITTVMSGLNNPRGVAFGPEGALYVAEAGDGTATGPCTTVAQGSNCYSETGSISRLFHGRQERVATGLPSIFNTARGDVVGPNDIAFQGRGTAFVTFGFGGAPSARLSLGEAAFNVGALAQVEPSGRWRIKADLAAFEDAHNPAGGPLDSDPYGVFVAGNDRYVADAGANDILHVAPNGTVSLVATFAPLPAPPPFNITDAVPTEVEAGPDGALYVSLLTGAPFAQGAAGIYRVVPGQPPVEVEGGFKAIIDFTFGPDGSMYVLEHATEDPFLSGPGRLTRILPDGTRVVITTALDHPGGVAVGTDGTIYVSNHGVSVGTGEVLRIVP